MAAENIIYTTVFLFFVCISLLVLSCLHAKENAPYMDEVFHIPQVQNYCMGKFLEWDPMITTLPGLYLTTIGVILPLHKCFNLPLEVLCGTFGLRCANIIFAAGNFYLLCVLVKRLGSSEQTQGTCSIVLKALTLSLFPVLYFFTFLYYTDSGSTFCVLLMYLLSTYGSHKMAALTGVVAVLFRQTNIIWVLFVAGLVAAKSLLERIEPEKKDISAATMQDVKFLLLIGRQLWIYARHNKKALLMIAVDIVRTTWMYILVGVMFVCFVKINGGIVVGAKEDHQVILHVPQLFYFVSFTTLFSIMFHVSWTQIKLFCCFLYQRILLVLLFVCVSAICVSKFTFAHRYLLADNRHYTFYVWAKIYRRHEDVKYALIPVYLWATWSILSALQCKNILWKCIFILCVSLNLVPSPLLEFRYFIIPYLIYRLNMPSSPPWKQLLELMLYVCVNIVTLYLFMEKPYQWEHISGNQRFMW